MEPDWKPSVPGASLGLAVIDLRSGVHFGSNEADPFPLASVAKLIIAAFALASCPDPEPVRDLVRRAISQHERQATARLLEIAGGVERVNEQLCHRSLAIRLHADQRHRVENAGTPEAVARFLKDLVNGRIVTGSGLQIVLEGLRDQEDPDSLFGSLPEPPDGWLHMTGGFEGVCNDVGILSFPDGWVICCAFVSGDPAGDWHELLEAMQETGHRICGTLQRDIRYHVEP